MADNVFSKDPYSVQLDKEAAALTGPQSDTGGRPAQGGTAFDPFKATDHFKEISRQTQVPVNVLMAYSEARAPADADQAVADANALALRLAPQLAEGADIQSLIEQETGSPDTKTAILSRAREIGAQMYGEDYGKLAISAEKSGGAFSRLGDAFAQGEAATIDRTHEFTRDMAAALEEGPVGRAFYNIQQKLGIADKTPEERAAEIRKSKSPFEAHAEKRLAELEAEGFRVQEWSDVKGLASALSFVGENLATSLPQMGVQVASGGFAPVTGILTLGAEANEELKERTDLSEADRVAVASGAGVAMWGLDAIGLGAIFGKATTGQIAKRALNGQLARAMVSKGFPAAAARMVQAGIVEGSTEALQEGIVMGVTAMSGGEYEPGEVAHRLTQAFAAGGAVGGTLRGGNEALGAGLKRLTGRDEDAPEDEAATAPQPGPQDPQPGPEGVAPEVQPDLTSQQASNPPQSGETITPPELMTFVVDTPQDVVDLSTSMLTDLRTKAEGYTGEDGIPVPGKKLSQEELQMVENLKAAAADPVGSGHLAGFRIKQPKPKGPLQTALDEGSPALFPDLSAGRAVDVIAGDGEVFSGTFAGETANHVAVVIEGERLEIPREDFELYGATMRPAGEQAGMPESQQADGLEDLIDPGDALAAELPGDDELNAAFDESLDAVYGTEQAAQPPAPEDGGMQAEVADWWSALDPADQADALQAVGADPEALGGVAFSDLPDAPRALIGEMYQRSLAEPEAADPAALTPEGEAAAVSAPEAAPAPEPVAEAPSAPEPVMTKAGKPFASEKAAQRGLKARGFAETHKIVPAPEGGFIGVPLDLSATPAPLTDAAPEIQQASKPEAAPAPVYDPTGRVDPEPQAAPAQPATSEQASKPVAPTPGKGDEPLADFSGYEVNGYEGGTRDDGADAPVKAAFHKDAKRYAKKAASILEGSGFARVPNGKKTTAPVSSNMAGMAVSGEVNMRLMTPGGNYMTLTIDAGSGLSQRTGNNVFMNLQFRDKPVGGKFIGNNDYPETTLEPSRLAAYIADRAAQVDQQTGKTPEPKTEPEAVAAEIQKSSKPASQQTEAEQEKARPTGYSFKLADRLSEKEQRALAKNRDEGTIVGKLISELDGLARRAEAGMRQEGKDARDYDVTGKDMAGNWNQMASVVGEAEHFARELLEASREAKTGNLPHPGRDEATGDYIQPAKDAPQAEHVVYDALQWLEDVEGMGLPIDQIVEPITEPRKEGEPAPDTSEMPDAEIFPATKDTVSLIKRAKDAGEIPMEDAQARVAFWKEVAADIGKDGRNSNKVVISLYDYTGAWSQPWVDAGYQVIRHDIKQGSDILLQPWILERVTEYRAAGMEIVGVLSACPCKTFSGAGARWWAGLHDVESPEALAKVFGPEAALTGAKSAKEYNVKLYEATRDVIALAKPTRFHVLENPVGRIQEATGLGKPSARFHPHNFGDPYTKQTQLFGPMRTDLPLANVDPVEGSKMQNKLRGDDPLGKEARSTTPEGFSYAFFMANDPDARKRMGETPQASKPASKKSDKAMTEADAEQLALQLVAEHGEATTGFERDGTKWSFDSALSMGRKARRDYKGKEKGKLFILPQGSLDAFVFNVADLRKQASQQAEKPKGEADGWRGNRGLRLFKRTMSDPANSLEAMRNGAVPAVAEYADWLNSLTDGQLDAIAPVFRDEYNPFHGAGFLADGGIAEAKAAFAKVGVADATQAQAKHSTPAEIEAEAAKVNTSPTDGQKEAGNYQKGHIVWQGMALAIETPKGTERSGTGPEGKRWAVTMPAHYGDFKGTEGADGDPVDFYLGDDPDSDFVLIVNQVDAETGKFDEHKVILGTGSTEEALALYEAGFNDGKGKDRIGSYSEVTVAGLKAWFDIADTTKPTEPVKAKAAVKPTEGVETKTTPQADDDALGDAFDSALDEVFGAEPGQGAESQQASKPKATGARDVALEVVDEQKGYLPAGWTVKNPRGLELELWDSKGKLVLRRKAVVAEPARTRESAQGVMREFRERSFELAGFAPETLEQANANVAAKQPEPAPAEVKTAEGVEIKTTPQAADPEEHWDAASMAEREGFFTAGGWGKKGTGEINEAAKRNIERDWADLTPTAKKLITKVVTEDGARARALVEDPAPRSAGEAAKSAVSNAAAGFADLAEGLGALFGGDGTKLSSGLTFDKETYEKAKPFFIEGMRRLGAAGSDIKDMMVALIRNLQDAGMTREQVANMKPYAVQFVKDVQAGDIALDGKSDTLDKSPNRGAADEPSRDQGYSDRPLGEASSGDGEQVAGGRAGAAGNGRGETGRRGNAGSGADRSGSAEFVAGHPQHDGPQSPARDRGLKATTRQGDNPGNYRIPADFALGAGSAGQKIKANIAAIKLVKALEAENRFATPQEQEQLAAYVGWGGLATVFDPKKAGASDQYGRAQAELKELLTDAEYHAAHLSTRNAHYTARGVVEAMWRGMAHFGFKGGRALEPTVGTGNFLGLQPEGMAAATDWYAAELDNITGLIAKHLYPDAGVMPGTGFENAPFAEGAFDIAIGNPPFGQNTAKDPRRPDLDGMKIHNYVIAKSGLHLRPGGIMAMVVTHRFLDTADPEGRAELAKRFRFMGAVRLPNDAFKANAGTEVVTDIVFLQRLNEGEKPDTGAAWLDTNGKIEVDGQEIRVNRYYQENPGNILGRSAMDGTMYGGGKRDGTGEYTVHGDGRDLGAAIDAAIREGMAAEAGALGDRSVELDAVAATLSVSDIPVGGMALQEDEVVRRLSDDSNGNAVTETVTPDTLWADDGPAWAAVEQAMRDLKAAARKGGVTEEVQTAFTEAAARAAMTAAGARKASSTASKADAAVYSLLDDLEGGRFRWKHDEALNTVTAAVDRKRLGGDRYQRLRGLLDLRQRTLDLIHAEKNEAEGIEAKRAMLNAAYDAFQATNGYISDPENARILQGDIGVESALETSYKPRITARKANPKKGIEAREAVPSSAKKADILSRRVNYPYKEITSAANAHDGLQISLSERGRLDLVYIANLTGQTTQEVIEELRAGEHPAIFFDPEAGSDGAYVQADEYLSGNVRKKLAEAKSRGLEANIRALEEVQPEPLPKERIKPGIRSQWLPQQVFADFLTDIGYVNPKISLIPEIGRLSASGAMGNLTEFGQQFRDGFFTPIELFNAAASGKALRAMESDGQGGTVENKQASDKANAMAARMGAVFEEWAYADAGRAELIVDTFNEKMNTHRKREFNGKKFLKTVGASPSITLRRTQADAAWRMIQEPNVLLDHVVGAGKTFTVITGIIERKRLGLSRKPMVVVPNHLVTQWAKDFYLLYPGARILAATPDDFSAKNRRRLFARIATGDWDAVIVGHSSLKHIAPPPTDEQDIIQERIGELKSALEQARVNGESGRTVKQIATRIENYEARIEELTNINRDELGIDFEAMGVDYLAVDEAHEFKNLEYATTGERVVGMNDPKGSQKAFDLYVKLRGLQKRGGGVAFATGTPVSNSLVEIFTVMSYLAHDELKSRGLTNFDAWSSAYAATETRMEYTATQKLKPRRVLSGLANLSSLGQLYDHFADVITSDTLKRIYAEEQEAKNKADGGNRSTEFPVPKVKGGGRRLDSAPLTEQQQTYMDYLVARMQKIEQMGGKPEYMAIDNALWVLSDARKMSLDIRTVDPTAARDENGKVARAARNIKEIYDRWDADKGTQMVFSDLSTPAKNAAKDAKKIIREALGVVLGTKAAAAEVKAMADLTLQQQWDRVQAKAAEVMEADNDGALTEKIEAHFAGVEDADAAMTVADVGFSVYDDLKAALVEAGIPSHEIAFIHDYNTPDQKAQLFAAVNEGSIRVLLGSSAKMGAGTNAQERLVALHHMDAPWRPSDVEQREGRIIRQGNKLYERDPSGFEVEIIAYSTEGSSDTVMWQILERKAGAIEGFRNASLDEVKEDAADSDQYAEFMASSTGNPVFRYKLEAERRLQELVSETSGLLLAKSSAQRFMADYASRTKTLESAITALEASAPGDLAFNGQTGSITELREAEAKSQAAYEAEYAAWMEKKHTYESEMAAAERRGEDRKEADERLRKAKMFPGAAPAAPNLTSQAMTDASGYARIVRTVLSRAGEIKGEGDLSFTMGGMKLRISRAPVGHDATGRTGRYTVAIMLGRRSYPIETREVQNPVQSEALRRALHPDNLASWHTEELEYRRELIARMKADKPKMEALANQEIDTSERDATADLLEWYKAEVALAENQADLDRASRSNPYIAGDAKRELSGFRGVKAEDPQTYEVDGEAFETTGLTAAYSLPFSMDVNRALEATRKRDGARAIILGKKGEKGFEVVQAVMEPVRARASRLGEAKFHRTRKPIRAIRPTIPALVARMQAELAQFGLHRRVKFDLASTLVDPVTGEPAHGALGVQWREFLTVSMMAPDKMFVLRHEALHAFRNPRLWGNRQFGVFTRQEWETLERHAKRDIRARLRVRKLYGHDHSIEQQLEEVIADQFAAYVARREVPPSPVARIFRRMADILTAVRRALFSLGIDQRNEIFAQLADGRLAARTEALPQRQPMLRPGGGISPDARFARADQKTVSKFIDAAVEQAARVAARVSKGAKTLPGTIRERASREGLSNALTDAMNAGDRGRYSVLGLVPGRPLFAELAKSLGHARVYLRNKEEMDALRNEWHSRTDEVAQEWRTLIRQNPEANAKLMDLMHRSTIAQIDPAGKFAGFASKWHIDTAADKRVSAELRAAAKAKVDEDGRRRKLHTDLRAVFNELPPEFQDLYRKVRDSYADLANAYEGALLDHMRDSADAALARAQEKHDARMQEIKDDDTLTKEERQDAEEEAREALRRAKKRNGWAKQAKIAGLRSKFETNRLKGPYFPLARFGDYFVTLRDSEGELVSFSLFETQREQQRFIKEQEAAGFVAQSGVMSNKTELKGAVDAEFVAQVEEILGDAEVPDSIMDEVWQKYLSTLPDMSIRTNRLHRKNREGYNPDAYRAFGKQVFHGAHQLARLKYSVKLEEALRKMRQEAAAAADPNRAGLVVNEIARRHEFIMNPTGHAWSAWASSAAFLWYLAVTPSAAMVNVSQTTVVGTPLLGAAFEGQGVAGAAKELARALGDFTRGKGHAMDSKRLTAGEKKALEEAYRRGTVDRTQAHDLAAVAETGVEYSDFRTRWMRRASFFFHHAERLNREVTFLAAYRMARKDGLSQVEARQKAVDLTWKIHFDYQNTSRPRAMQGDVAKVVLTFRNFSVNMIWRFLRDSHQAMNGGTPRERAEARAQVLGITASMAMHAGITGVWGFNLIMGLVGLAFEGGGEEAEERLKGLLIGDGSNPIRRNLSGVFLNGLPGHVLGLSLSERLGMPSFWFRESYKDLEGRDWYIYMMEELLGPVPGIGEGMVRGLSLARNGEILRGVEAAVPKFVRDGMRALRYAGEGVTTMKGDPIVDDVSLYQVLAQASGFTPAQVAERYKLNSRMMNMQHRIQDERRTILAEIRNSYIEGKPLTDKQQKRWAEFNARYPEYPITPESVKRSVSSRRRAIQRNEFGVQLNPKLNERIRLQISKPIYG